VFPVIEILFGTQLHIHKVLSPCHSECSILWHLGVCNNIQFLTPSVIFGRAIKNEHLALSVLCGTAAISYAAMGGSKKQAPASGKTLVEKVKEAVPINASSRCVVFAFIAENEMSTDFEMLSQ
jgi:F-type H+-transporting ATPase subunit k